MARTVLPIVGAVVGFYFGGPTGAQIGFALGGAIGGAVDPVVNRGPKIGETGAQTSAEGAPRAIVYGTASVTGNVIATGPMIETTNTETQSKGGPVSETSVAYRNYAIRICEGPIAAVLRAWQDDKLVYDVRPGSLMLAQSAQWLSNKIIYLGTETQLPDIFLELNVSGPGETPAYRGTAYIVFGLEDLTDRRGSIPQYRFEVAGTASLTQQLAPLIVHPWIPNNVSPLSDFNEHTFTYVGFMPQSHSQPYPISGTDFIDLEDAVFEARDSWNTDYPNPPLITNLYPVGYSEGGSSSIVQDMYPSAPSLADEQEFLFLHYNELVPVSYVAPADYPMSSEDVPLYDDGVWGASSPRAAVWYTAPVHEPGVQYVRPDRLHATETYSNIFTSDGEVFYTLDAIISAYREPSAPAGYIKVTGTAKQLAAIEYRTGDLYQNGVGPVLLPDDANYNNATFWSDAKAAAITAGTIEADVASPVVVSEYAYGYGTATGAAIPLSGIVADIHDRCNVPVAKFDVSELTDLVAGLVLAGEYSGADAINALRGPYFFDKTEYDKKLWYPKRGAAVVETLTIDDLVEEPDTARREQALEFPKKLHLFYQHAASGYAAVKATSSRSSPDARVIGEMSVQVPVVLNENQAAQTSHKMHKVAWTEAEGEVQLSVPESFIRLVPSDNVGLFLRGQVKRLRIEKTEHADGVITLTLRHDRQSAYTSVVTGVPIPLPTPPPSVVTNATMTTFAVLDIGARADNEDDLHYLVAGTGVDAGWHGWALQRSLDGGATYATVQSFTNAAVMGSLLDAVPAASVHYTDTTNTVRVQLYRDTQTIDSITTTQFLAEGGAFALENANGSWEVMQYLDAVEESGGGIFALTTLHRGRLNSGASAHAAGAKFVMLKDAWHIPAQSAWIGQLVRHRAVSLGQSSELGLVQNAAYVGRSQIEWEVASLALARSGADVITATWAPRHRFGTDDAPVASVNFTGYRLTIDGTVTFDTTTAGFTYDASALGNPLTVSVSALNRITGAGPATSGSV